MLLILLRIQYPFDFVGIFYCVLSRYKLLAISIELPVMVAVTALARVIFVACTKKADVCRLTPPPLNLPLEKGKELFEALLGIYLIKQPKICIRDRAERA